MQISIGTPECVRYRAAELYDVAFGSKLSLAVPDQKRRIDMLAKGFVLEHSISAITNGELVGLAGFSTPDGSLTSGIGYRSLLSDLGFLGGNRAAALFSVYERLGFIATKTERFEILRWLLGFGASTTMIYSLKRSAC